MIMIEKIAIADVEITITTATLVTIPILEIMAAIMVDTVEIVIIAAEIIVDAVII